MEKGTNVSQKIFMQNTDPVMPVLRQMEVDETHAWDMRRRNTVQATMGTVSAQYGFKFVSRRGEGKIYVTRVK